MSENYTSTERVMHKLAGAAYQMTFDGEYEKAAETMGLAIQYWESQRDESLSQEKAAEKYGVSSNTQKASADGGSAVGQVSAKEVASEIIDEGGVSKFVCVHGGNKTKYVSWKLIQEERGLSQNDAKAVKEYLEKQFNIDEVEV